MPEPQRDHAERYAGLQQMHRRGVANSMGDTRRLSKLGCC